MSNETTTTEIQVGDMIVVTVPRGRKDYRAIVTRIIDHGGVSQHPIYCAQFVLGKGVIPLRRDQFTKSPA